MRSVDVFASVTKCGDLLSSQEQKSTKITCCFADSIILCVEVVRYASIFQQIALWEQQRCVSTLSIISKYKKYSCTLRNQFRHFSSQTTSKHCLLDAYCVRYFILEINFKLLVRRNNKHFSYIIKIKFSGSTRTFNMFIADAWQPWWCSR